MKKFKIQQHSSWSTWWLASTKDACSSISEWCLWVIIFKLTVVPEISEMSDRWAVMFMANVMGMLEICNFSKFIVNIWWHIVRLSVTCMCKITVHSQKGGTPPLLWMDCYFTFSSTLSSGLFALKISSKNLLDIWSKRSFSEVSDYKLSLCFCLLAPVQAVWHGPHNIWLCHVRGSLCNFVH